MARKPNPLAAYNAKRDFARTAEPEGKAAPAGGNSFIVQKHAARRLHWDFRLEVNGVLKSWAVTKGPSVDPAVKRLAVRTEDHPLSYATFEGTIPKGEYGGGTVMLWDRGTWAPVAGKSVADLDEGHLHFTLQGERMKGEWMLIRLKPRAGEKRENWLLRKVTDEYAGEGDTLVEQALTSVATGRSMAAIEAGAKPDVPPAPKPDERPARRKTTKLPAFRKPQLATLVDDVPTGNGWMHEIKFDGYRLQARLDGQDVRLLTRSGLDWTDRFGHLHAALQSMELPDGWYDGEIIMPGTH